jgi:hypothetical protein
MCHYTGFVSQYKAIHDNQLLWNNSKDIDDLIKFNEKMEKLSGEEF